MTVLLKNDFVYTDCSDQVVADCGIPNVLPPAKLQSLVDELRNIKKKEKKKPTKSKV